MRGEYGWGTLAERMDPELPPHARRIHHGYQRLNDTNGTTSACAENTSKALASDMISRNYLRVRGEYLVCPHSCHRISELPPRARRILTRPTSLRNINGTTSACAENTMPPIILRWWGGNYLRVRGEYVTEPPSKIAVLELPPRARRILGVWRTMRGLAGTTSACAENTR